MVRLSRSEDPGVAMKAGRWLVAYGESRLDGKRQRKEETASTVSPSGSRHCGYADSRPFGIQAAAVA
jgi:hypothetical protein